MPTADELARINAEGLQQAQFLKTEAYYTLMRELRDRDLEQQHEREMQPQNSSTAPLITIGILSASKSIRHLTAFMSLCVILFNLCLRYFPLLSCFISGWYID